MAIQDIADVKIDQPAALERFHTPIRPMDRDNCDISTLLLCPHLCGKAPPQYSASNPEGDGPRRAPLVATPRKDLVADHCSVWQDILALEGNRDWWLGITAAGMRWRRGTLRSEHIEVIVAAR